MVAKPASEALRPSDRELVVSWKAGSLSAFESLVRRYQPRLVAFLERRLGSREDAEDVTQRAFVTVHQGIDRYREERPFATWIFMIARRQAIDFQRRSGSRKRVQEQLSSFAVPEASETESPIQALDQRERAAGIWRWARIHLTEQAFTALWLQVQEEMSDAEIARVMKLTRTHVRVVLHRARKRLIVLRAQSTLPPFAETTDHQAHSRSTSKAQICGSA